MANLYYNAAVDATWDELGNWWNDAVFSDPALALPADGDTVYLAAQMDSGPSTTVTLNHIYVADASTGGGGFYVNFTGADGNATFYDDSNNSGIVAGDATFNGTSVNNENGTVYGNATFNGTSVNNENGIVAGDATFNDTSFNYGTVAGDATFNNSSYNQGGTVAGNATFRNASYNTGTIEGNATVYYDGGDGQTPIGGIVNGTVTYIGFPPLAVGCEAYWNLNDDGSGGVSLVDSTGNGYALTNNNGVTLGTGIIAGDATFNGSQSLSSSAVFSGDFSISLWVNASTYPSYSLLYSATGISYYLNADGSVTVNDGAEFGDINNVGYCPLNTWTYLTLVRSSGTNYLYVNGSNLASGTQVILSSGVLYLGQSNVGINGLHGGIDEVGIWSRALSSTEVINLYNGGAGRTYPFPQTATSTLYYNNSQEDGDWGNILNWWQDSAFTFSATALPTSTNPVNLYGSITQNTQGADQCFCHDASFWSANFGVGLTIASTGIVNVHGSSVFDGYTEDGISMHDSTIIGPDGVIATNAVLRDGATNQGTIIGNAEVHYDGGNGVFPIGGTVGGSVTYIGWPALTPQWFNDDPSVGGGNDGDFSNLLNWWTDSNYNVRPLNAAETQELPDVSTDVFIAPDRGFYANTGAINPTVNSVTTNNGYIAYISITVSNGVQFSGDDYYGCYHATIYGNVTFSGTAYNDSSMILGNADYKSAVSLVTSFYYNSLQRILSGGVYGSNTMTVSIPTGGDQMIARLLNLPWFINL